MKVCQQTIAFVTYLILETNHSYLVSHESFIISKALLCVVMETVTRELKEFHDVISFASSMGFYDVE